jgi:hypothetical protein
MGTYRGSKTLITSKLAFKRKKRKWTFWTRNKESSDDKMFLSHRLPSPLSHMEQIDIWRKRTLTKADEPTENIKKKNLVVFLVY